MEKDIAKRVASQLTYITINPKIESYNDVDIQKFKILTTLEFQGSAVQISDNFDLKLYPITLSAIFGCTKELILKMQDERNVLIYSNVDEELYIRPRGIILKIWDEICRLRKLNNQKERKQKTIIDVSRIWNININKNKDTDLVEETITFLKFLSKELTYSEEIEIVGEIPALPFLVATYFIRPYGRKIFYSINKNNIINLF